MTADPKFCRGRTSRGHIDRIVTIHANNRMRACNYVGENATTSRNQDYESYGNDEQDQQGIILLLPGGRCRIGLPLQPLKGLRASWGKSSTAASKLSGSLGRVIWIGIVGRWRWWCIDRKRRGLAALLLTIGCVSAEPGLRI